MEDEMKESSVLPFQTRAGLEAIRGGEGCGVGEIGKAVSDNFAEGFLFCRKIQFIRKDIKNYEIKKKCIS